jgi:hypothetical protein
MTDAGVVAAPTMRRGPGDTMVGWSTRAWPWSPRPPAERPGWGLGRVAGPSGGTGAGMQTSGLTPGAEGTYTRGDVPAEAAAMGVWSAGARRLR